MRGFQENVQGKQQYHIWKFVFIDVVKTDATYVIDLTLWVFFYLFFNGIEGT